MGFEEQVGALNGARVVLTGATGFVGAALAKRLLVTLDCEVHAITRPSGGDLWRLSGIENQIVWHKADLTNESAVRDLLATIDPDVVFHLATYYAPDSTGIDPRAIVDVNVTAGLVLASACAKLPSLRLLVNVGTCAEFGDLREPACEDSPLAPNSVYASTKAAGSIVMRQAAEEHGVPFTTLRLYNMYGEYEKPSRLFPHVVLSLIDGRDVPLTAGEQAKDYTYVGDVVDAFLLAAAQPDVSAGETYNIASGQTISIRAFIESIASHFPDAEDHLLWGAAPYRENEMWFQGATADKARASLGWVPRQALDESVADVVAWYVKHRSLYDPAPR